MSFRLWNIFYVFALLAAAMATFGVLGIVACGVVLSFWAWMYSSAKPKTLVDWLWLIGAVLLFLILLLPAFQEARESSRAGWCHHNMRNIALAVVNYDKTHVALPPALTVDGNGKPIHSWRSLILARLDRADLYESLEFDNGWWDSTANRKVTSTAMDVF